MENNFKVGDVIRLKKTIKRRPDYFNDEGYMDFLLGGENTTTVVEVNSFAVLIEDSEGNSWALKPKDLVLVKSTDSLELKKEAVLTDKKRYVTSEAEAPYYDEGEECFTLDKALLMLSEESREQAEFFWSRLGRPNYMYVYNSAHDTIYTCYENYKEV